MLKKIIIIGILSFFIITAGIRITSSQFYSYTYEVPGLNLNRGSLSNTGWGGYWSSLPNAGLNIFSNLSSGGWGSPGSIGFNYLYPYLGGFGRSSGNVNTISSGGGWGSLANLGTSGNTGWRVAFGNSNVSNMPVWSGFGSSSGWSNNTIIGSSVSTPWRGAAWTSSVNTNWGGLNYGTTDWDGLNYTGLGGLGYNSLNSLFNSGWVQIYNPQKGSVNKGGNNSAYEDDVPADTLIQRVHELVNKHRESEGLTALIYNAVIAKQAQIHSENMASGAVAFSHDGFYDRTDEIKKVISYKAVAENVGYNMGYSNPADIAVEGWLKSTGHKENIEGDYNLTGIGVAKSGSGVYYFTQIFIRTRN